MTRVLRRFGCEQPKSTAHLQALEWSASRLGRGTENRQLSGFQRQQSWPIRALALLGLYLKRHQSTQLSSLINFGPVIFASWLQLLQVSYPG